MAQSGFNPLGHRVQWDLWEPMVRKVRQDQLAAQVQQASRVRKDQQDRRVQQD